VTGRPLTWLGIVRLGLVQTALGAMVVLMTSTVNRVMVVELAFPAVVPGVLVSLHYLVQALRPRWGYGSDRGGRRTPWIVGGMATLALGSIGGAGATVLAASHPVAGIALGVLCFLAIGIGVGAAGTSLLALLASRVEPRLRGAAAATVWIMMIAGFAVTAPLAGHLLEPFSLERLVAVVTGVSAIAFAVAVAAVWRVEPQAEAPARHASMPGGTAGFLAALRTVLAEPKSRRFTLFVFISMVAYSAQELVLEPFSGLVFGLTPGGSTTLTGLQHAGVLVGMVAVSIVTASRRAGPFSSLRLWTVLGCAFSAVPMLGLAGVAVVGTALPLRPLVFALGVFNGVFAVAAIGTMMSLAHDGAGSREGTRLGLWGAAQAIAFGLGGIGGSLAVDAARHLVEGTATAYGLVFLAEAAVFLAAAHIANTLEPGRLLRANAPVLRRFAGSLATTGDPS
jgi:BCD family chlorophyll transporter-like MFS transporter